jgi:hypothetical protein
LPLSRALTLAIELWERCLSNPEEILFATRAANARHFDAVRDPHSMIYRILANAKKGLFSVSRQEFIPGSPSPLRGAWTAGLAGMNVKFPEIENRRVRFFFTEKGWREVGRAIVARAIREGHVIRVIRQKNPMKSQIFYKDADQVAILPSRPKSYRKKRGKWEFSA